MDLQTLMKKSESKILTIHPYLQNKAFELIKRAYKAGVMLQVTQGIRTKEYQDSLYAIGRTEKCDRCQKSGSKCTHKVTNAMYPNSYHCWGLAFDVAVLKPDGTQIDWSLAADGDKDGQKDWYEVGPIGESLGLTWGGRWSDPHDPPHYQYTEGLTIKDLIAGKEIKATVQPASRGEEPKPEALKKEEQKVIEQWKIDALKQAEELGIFAKNAHKPEEIPDKGTLAAVAVNIIEKIREELKVCTNTEQK